MPEYCSRRRGPSRTIACGRSCFLRRRPSRVYRAERRSIPVHDGLCPCRRHRGWLPRRPPSPPRGFFDGAHHSHAVAAAAASACEAAFCGGRRCSAPLPCPSQQTPPRWALLSLVRGGHRLRGCRGTSCTDATSWRLCLSAGGGPPRRGRLCRTTAALLRLPPPTLVRRHFAGSRRRPAPLPGCRRWSTRRWRRHRATATVTPQAGVAGRSWLMAQAGASACLPEVVPSPRASLLRHRGCRPPCWCSGACLADGSGRRLCKSTGGNPSSVGVATALPWLLPPQLVSWDAAGCLRRPAPVTFCVRWSP